MSGCFQIHYNNFNAFLIMSSTDRFKPSALMILSNTASAPVFGNPKANKADNASYLLLLYETEIFDSADQLAFLVLSFSSMITRWAVLAPMPLMDWMARTSSVAMAFKTSPTLMEERIRRAVFGPMPFTESRSLKSSRYSSFMKP